MTVSMHGLNLSGITWNHRVTPRAERPQGERAFHYISDHQDMLWHPATGEHVDSKSRFRQITRERGCIEVGNEVQKREVVRPDKGQIGRDIKNAIERLKSERNR